MDMPFDKYIKEFGPLKRTKPKLPNPLPKPSLPIDTEQANERQRLAMNEIFGQNYIPVNKYKDS